MTLGERVAVLRDGVDPAVRRARRCCSTALRTCSSAAFIGSPAMNLVEARLAGERWLRRAASSRCRAPPRRRARRGPRAAADELRVRRPPRDPSWPRIGSSSTWSSSWARSATCCSRVDAPPVATEDVKAAIGGESGADEGRLLADDRRARFTARIQGRPPAVGRGSGRARDRPRAAAPLRPRHGPGARTRPKGGTSGMRFEPAGAAAMRPASWRRVWCSPAAALAVVVLLVVLASGEGKSLAPSAAAAYAPPPGEREVRLPDRRRLPAAGGRAGRLA